MRESPLKYIWEGDKLIGVALPSCRNASDTQPDKLDLELMRIFREWGELQAENERLKGRYKDYERLWEIAGEDKCDGSCDERQPFGKCPECEAGCLLNELGEIRGAGLQDIEQALKGE